METATVFLSNSDSDAGDSGLRARSKRKAPPQGRQVLLFSSREQVYLVGTFSVTPPTNDLRDIWGKG